VLAFDDRRPVVGDGSYGFVAIMAGGMQSEFRVFRRVYSGGCAAALSKATCLNLLTVDGRQLDRRVIKRRLKTD
jgi:hypothetical protein